MKYVKTVSLTGLMVMALMGVVTSSASANARMCSTDGPGTACTAGHGKIYKGRIVAKVNASGALLTATSPDNTTVKCTESTAEGEVSNGETGTGKISKLTFGGCSSAFCFGTMTASSPAGWNVTATTTLPGVENTNGKTDILIGAEWGKFACSFPATTCEYSASSPEGHIVGSHNLPQIVFTNITLTKTVGPEFQCGIKADWSGTYNVTTPGSLIIE